DVEEGKSFLYLMKDFCLLLSNSTFGQKVLRYQEYGLLGIQSKTKNSHYSKAFKDAVIQEHLEEGTPFSQLALKYQIPQAGTVRGWIIRYTRGEEIRSYTPKPEVYTMRGKKTTQEEKIKIVKTIWQMACPTRMPLKNMACPITMSIRGSRSTRTTVLPGWQTDEDGGNQMRSKPPKK